MNGVFNPGYRWEPEVDLSSSAPTLEGVYWNRARTDSMATTLAAEATPAMNPHVPWS